MGVELPVVDYAFSDGSTRYKKNIKSIPTEPASSGLFVLKDGGTNAKLGSLMTKSRWKGMRIYGLTLTERTTCWAGCQNLSRCYGDNMPFARRYQHGDELVAALLKDLSTLQSNKRTSKGFIVRLHVLGDFYSEEYVRFWATALQTYPSLRIFGYTHHRHASPIGAEISRLVAENKELVSILRSDADEVDDPLPKAMTILRDEPAVAGTVICPEQSGRSPSCAECGLCMGGRVSISFIDHSRESKEARLHRQEEGTKFIATLISGAP